MSPSQHEIYRTGVALARQLGWDPNEVPKPFQLNELEDYIQQAREALSRKPVIAPEPPVVESPDGSSSKR